MGEESRFSGGRLIDVTGQRIFDPKTLDDVKADVEARSSWSRTRPAE